MCLDQQQTSQHGHPRRHLHPPSIPPLSPSRVPTSRSPREPPSLNPDKHPQQDHPRRPIQERELVICHLCYLCLHLFWIMVHPGPHSAARSKTAYQILSGLDRGHPRRPPIQFSCCLAPCLPCISAYSRAGSPPASCLMCSCLMWVPTRQSAGGVLCSVYRPVSIAP